MQLSGRLALVTGATRGLGRALCVALTGRGVRLAMVARDDAALAALATELGTGARGYAFDLRDYAHADALVRRIEFDLGPVDLLVCNAATGAGGEVADVPLDAYEAAVAVDLLAAVALTRAVVGALRRRGDGALCFVLSGVVWRALPAFSTYAAGKAALAGFVDALRVELLGSGVHVLSVFPGTMDTDFVARMPSYGPAARLGGARRAMAPGRVAERIVHALEADRSRLVVRGPAWVVRYLDVVFPTLVDRLLARRHRRLNARAGDAGEARAAARSR